MSSIYWHKWFAWYPVKVHGTYAWCEYVYRRSGNTYVDYDDWRWYHYGTIFDVINSPEHIETL